LSNTSFEVVISYLCVNTVRPLMSLCKKGKSKLKKEMEISELAIEDTHKEDSPIL